MSEPFTRAGLKCLRSERRYSVRDEPDMVRIKKGNYVIHMDADLFDEMDDTALTSFFESHYADAVKHRMRIFRMGLIESYKRGLSMRFRWRWECRECHAVDPGFEGYRRALDAEVGAQNHVDERHAE